jgi:hypothetical protein
MLAHKVHNCFEWASMLLGPKEFGSNVDAFRHTRVFLMLILGLHWDMIHMSSSCSIGWSCPLGPRKLDHFFDLGLVCSRSRSYVHFTRREWRTPNSAAVSWREITLLTETISLLQKTELLDNSITVADLACRTPRQMGKDGPRHDYERDWGWAWRKGNMRAVWCGSPMCANFPSAIFQDTPRRDKLRWSSTQNSTWLIKTIFLFLCRSHTFLTSDPAAEWGRIRPLYFEI